MTTMPKHECNQCGKWIKKGRDLLCDECKIKIYNNMQDEEKDLNEDTPEEETPVEEPVGEPVA